MNIMSSQTWTTTTASAASATADPWRRKSASAAVTSSTATSTTLFTADSFGIWNRSFPPQEDAWGNNVVADSKPVKNADNSDDVVLLNKKSNPVEFRDLKRELDYYKLNAQILMQTKDLLEEKLEKVSQELQDLKLSAGSATNTVISRPTPPPAHLDTSSVASVDSSPSEDNLHLGSVSCSPPASSLKSYVKFNQENSFFNAKKHEGDYDVPLDVGKKSAWISAMENLNYVREEYKPAVVSKGHKTSFGNDQRRKSGSQYQIPSVSGAQMNFYAPRYEEHEDRVEKHNGNISGDEYDMVSGVDESQWELCRHFLKGRCRYKRLCKFSHEVRSCPYCSIELPLSKIAASTHLSRCFRAKCGKPVTQPLTCGPNINFSGVDMGVSNVKQIEPEEFEDSDQETTSNLEE